MHVYLVERRAVARLQTLPNRGGEYAGETKRFLLHFATQYRSGKLRPTKHFVLTCFHRFSTVLYSLLFLFVAPFIPMTTTMTTSASTCLAREFYVPFCHHSLRFHDKCVILNVYRFHPGYFSRLSHIDRLACR